MRSVFHRMTDVYEAMDEAWDGIDPGTGCMTSVEVDTLMLDTPENGNSGKDNKEEEEEDVVQEGNESGKYTLREIFMATGTNALPPLAIRIKQAST